MKSWNDIKSEFAVDGSLRDIYVDSSSPEIWRDFIRSVKTSKYKYAFSHGGKSIEFPSSLSDIKTLQETDPTILHIWLNQVIQINCHFFVSSKIELDISPKDIAGEAEYRLLTNFLCWLQEGLNSRVSLTHENSQMEVILSVG